MSNRRILPAVLLAAALLPVPAASAMPVDRHGVHHRATTADVDRTATAPAPTVEPAGHEFPWIEVAGLAGLVTAAGAGAMSARRRSAPA
jgi:hypothetical protein